MPFVHNQISAFAYIDPAEESAIRVEGIPGFGKTGDVLASWCDGYPTPEAHAGDVITLIASQRPIATIVVTSK